MFPKAGKTFPGGKGRKGGNTSYAATIAAALRTDLGRTHRAIKTVMQWTGASERTVKHWFLGSHGPGGDYLIMLMSESEIVLEAVLAAAGRRDLAVAGRVLDAHSRMVEAVALFERERVREKRVLPADRPGRGEMPAPVPDDRGGGRLDDRSGRTAGDSLNRRQRWYLDALATGRDLRAADLQRRWRVSGRTARRDVAALRALGLITFVGTARQGRYWQTQEDERE